MAAKIPPQGDVALHLFMPPQALRVLYSKDIMEPRVSLALAREQYITYLRGKAQERSKGMANRDLEGERTRQAHHDANIKAIKEALLKGALVEADKIDKTWSDKIAAIRSRLLNIPAKLTHQIVAAEADPVIVEAVLMDGIRDVLTELAEEEAA